MSTPTTPNPTTPNPASTDWLASHPKHTSFIILIFAVLIGISATCAGVRHRESESLWWLLILFVGPCLLQLIGLWVLRKRTTSAFWYFNCCATFLCQIGYCSLWIVYSTSWKTSQGISWLALGWIFLLLLFVMIMTFASMRGPVADPAVADTPGATPDVAANGGAVAETRWRKFSRWSTRFFNNLSDGVGTHPFWAVMFFMALFLGVSYLFGFALAFHDQYAITIDKDSPALHMANFSSIDEAKTAKPDGGAQAGAGNNTAKDNSPPNGVTPTPDNQSLSTVGAQEEFRFYFEEVRANVSRSRVPCQSVSPNPNPKGMDVHAQIQSINSCSLDNMANRLVEKTNKGARVKVTLLGHTDNEPIKPSKPPKLDLASYLSNYELSESRAKHVEYELLRKLRVENTARLENIEWVIFPAADEALPQLNRGAVREEMFPEELRGMNIAPPQERKAMLDKLENYHTTEEIDSKLDPHEKRVVIATIETISESPVAQQLGHYSNVVTTGQKQTIAELEALKRAHNEYIEQSKAKPLELMDYIYFSIYTITTTGYGDIVPTTAYAKFIASVANIFEVIFLVVFFNALLSLKRDPNDGSPDRNLNTGRPPGQPLGAEEPILFGRRRSG